MITYVKAIGRVLKDHIQCYKRNSTNQIDYQVLVSIWYKLNWDTVIRYSLTKIQCYKDTTIHWIQCTYDTVE